jgi:hypothetical protein
MDVTGTDVVKLVYYTVYATTSCGFINCKHYSSHTKTHENYTCIYSIATSSFPVCAITASGVPGCTLVSMNRFSTLCG